MTQEELISFRKNIEDIAKNKRSAILSNDSPEQANVILANIFCNADKYVRIFAKNLDGEVSSNPLAGNYYFSAVDQFLKKPGSKLNVLIEEPPAKESKLFSFLRLKSNNSNQVEFKFASDSFKAEIKSLRPDDQPASKESELLHFAVGDNTMFRIEYDLTSHKANFSFNNLEVSNKLNELFDKHFKSTACVPVSEESILKFRSV